MKIKLFFVSLTVLFAVGSLFAIEPEYEQKMPEPQCILRDGKTVLPCKRVKEVLEKIYDIDEDMSKGPDRLLTLKLASFGQKMYPKHEAHIPFLVDKNLMNADGSVDPDVADIVKNSLVIGIKPSNPEFGVPVFVNIYNPAPWWKNVFRRQYWGW